MMKQSSQQEIQAFLLALISEGSSSEANAWLEQKISKLNSHFNTKDFYLAFALAAKHYEKDVLKINREISEKANMLRKGFNPSGLSKVQLARMALTTCIPSEDSSLYLKILDTLFSAAAVNELVALYAALPLLPHPELLRSRASEGVRSNMTVVFEAIALNNPYPSEYLDDNAFNQMVLKAVFIERPLYKIYGLDERANVQLARMLSDYAHERWAASRTVTPELWRPVTRFVDTAILNDLKKLLNDGTAIEKQAAMLVANKSYNENLKNLTSSFKEMQTQIENGSITWETVAGAWFASK